MRSRTGPATRRSRSEGERRASAPGRPRCVNVVDVLNIQQVNDKGSSGQMLLALIGVIMNKMLMRETWGLFTSSRLRGSCNPTASLALRLHLESRLSVADKAMLLSKLHSGTLMF